MNKQNAEKQGNRSVTQRDQHEIPAGTVGRGGLTGHRSGHFGRDWPRGSLYVFQHVHLRLCMPGEGTCVHLVEEGKASLGASMGESKRRHR